MKENTEKMLALTFDDGPNTTVMPRILELLQAYGAKATFFAVGSNITEESAHALRLAVDCGCEIGNHSQNHLHMSQMDEGELLREVETARTRIHQATGIVPVLFRPPYIDVSAKMLNAISMPFITGRGNNDWDPACTVDQRIEGALRDAEDGAILLMHCFEGNEATVEALKVILPELKRQEYQMVTVSELFSRKGIRLKNGVLYEKAVIL